MVPIAKSNQNTSSGPSNRKGTSPRTVEMTVSITAQHHESRKATLVKRKIRKAEHEKHTYERNWYQQDDSQRIFKRLERHAAHDIDDSSHQKQKPCVFPTLFLTPAPVRRRRSLVPDRHQFRAGNPPVLPENVHQRIGITLKVIIAITIECDSVRLVLGNYVIALVSGEKISDKILFIKYQ